MGNPKFYYFPFPDGSRRVEIDLGETLAEMYSEFEIDRSTAIAYDGSMFSKSASNREVVTIQRDRFIGGEDLAIKFRALQNHLDKGYSCAFAADSDRAYCFAIKQKPKSGDQTIVCSGDPFRTMTGLQTPFIDDFLTIDSQNPELVTEHNKIHSSYNRTIFSAIIGGSIPLVNKVDFSYSNAAFVRHYRYFPVLKRHEADVGKNIITNEGGRLFSLNIRLVIDYALMFSFHPDVDAYGRQSSPFVTDTPSIGGRITLDDPSLSIDRFNVGVLPNNFNLRR